MLSLDVKLKKVNETRNYIRLLEVKDYLMSEKHKKL